MRRIIIILALLGTTTAKRPKQDYRADQQRASAGPQDGGHPNTTILVPFVDRDTRVAENKGVEEGEEPDVGSRILMRCPGRSTPWQLL